MSPAGRLLAAPVRAYRLLVSPLMPAHCRFVPTCSAYALRALEQHGAARGGWLALRRLVRCQPFNPGGHDPVPSTCGRLRVPGSAARRVVRDDAGGSPPSIRPHSVARHRAPPSTAADLGAPS